ncbi:hypothetical protein [Pseudaminobacter sp. NGMCC 1.201702]|uniref:hypothetical protein n=1 Tax=Pseudaminobacter sp. NGMCC 1.201702 TaxID=3391825 RepID=UPI0039EFF8D5
MKNREALWHRRAIVALARRIVIVKHQMWLTEEPFRYCARQQNCAAIAQAHLRRFTFSWPREVSPSRSLPADLRTDRQSDCQSRALVAQKKYFCYKYT